MGFLLNWWEKSPARLENEVRLMKKKFPQFQLGLAKQDHGDSQKHFVRLGQKYWLGNLNTVSGSKYSILLTYPKHYPGQEIRAYVLSPRIEHHQHRYGDGHLCLYSNDHGGRGQGFGLGMTAVSYVGWVAAWLHAHEIYLKRGIWPDNNFFDRRNS